MHLDTAVIFFIGVPVYLLMALLSRKFAYVEASIGLLICSIVSLFTENTGIICLVIYFGPFIVSAIMKPIENRINKKKQEKELHKFADIQKGKVGVIHELEDGNLYLFLSGRYWQISEQSRIKYNCEEQDAVKVLDINTDRLIVKPI